MDGDIWLFLAAVALILGVGSLWIFGYLDPHNDQKPLPAVISQRPSSLIPNPPMGRQDRVWKT